MAKYTIGSVAKALVAGGIAAVGALGLTAGMDLSSLDLMTVLGALGIGLTAAAGTFATKNKGTDSSVPEVPQDGAVEAVEDILEAKAAVDKQLSAVRDAVSIGTGVIQVGTQIAGSLAQQVINSIKLPKL